MYIYAAHHADVVGDRVVGGDVAIRDVVKGWVACVNARSSSLIMRKRTVTRPARLVGCFSLENRLGVLGESRRSYRAAVALLSEVPNRSMSA